MGQRSRKRRREGGRPDRMAELYARGRAKDAEARAKLKPLEPGERPRSLTVAAIVAAVLAVANVGTAAFTDTKELGDWQQALLATGILTAAAVGMWFRQYWAVLGFQVILLLAILGASRLLLVASNALGALLAVVIIVGGGALFWSLIRAMGRLQIPKRRVE